MKKLMLFALVAGVLSACGNSKKSSEILAEEGLAPGDTMIEIIGEWVEIPVAGQAEAAKPAKKMKFNRDNTMEGTPVMKKVKKVNHKNAADSIEMTTMVYQLWDQEGDTLTIVSQSAVDSQLQDTVTWGIVSLTSDSLQLHNAKQGAKHYVRHK